MFRFLINKMLVPFSWKDRFSHGKWQYQFNSRNGRRRVVQVRTEGHQPIDQEWLLRGRGLPYIKPMNARRRYL